MFKGIIIGSFSFNICLLCSLSLFAVQKVRYPLDYQQGAVFSLIGLTYTPIEYTNEASRVLSLLKLAGTGKSSTALIVSAGNPYTSPVRELYTGAGKITRTAFFSASTSITSAVGAGVGAGEDAPPSEAVASLLEATLFWEFAPFLMRAQGLGLPSVLEDAWGAGCMCLGVLPGAKAPRDDVAM